MNGKKNDNVEYDVINSDSKVIHNEATKWGYRHQQCFVLFLCLMVAYSMRTCMGVSLVAMVDSTEYLNSSEHGILQTLLIKSPYPRFEWSKGIQDTILAAFTWGYMTLQIPAGQLAHRFGTRYLLTGALMINGFVSFCTPWAAAYGGWIFTVICRIVQGLSQACVVPGMHTAFGKWTPLEERGRLTAFAYGGQALGTVLGMPITGFIAASPLGWPGIFRFYGILAALTGAMVWILGADSPAQHKKISLSERRYIEEALGQHNRKSTKPLSVPWKKILKCRGMYAIVLAHIGHSWGQLTLYSEVPSFMHNVMGVNIKANGLLTALPFFVMWFTNFFFSWFTDFLIVKKFLSPTNTRKLANSIGCFVPAIGLVALAFVKKDIYVVETILVLTCAFKIAAHLGFHINHIDIAPNFAGTLMSMSNFVSNSVGSLAPIVAGSILSTDPHSEFLWRKVFLISAGMYFFSNIAYLFLGTAELAEWNEPSEDDEYKEEHLMKETKDNSEQEEIKT